MQDARGRVIFGRGESLVDPFALASRRHDAGSAEAGKMTRDFRLTNAQDFDEVANADPAGPRSDSASGAE
jgi:hypothetical protein